MLLRSLPLFAALLLVGSAMGQTKGKNKNKDKNTAEGPHKDLYLPVECHVTANGGPTDQITPPSGRHCQKSSSSAKLAKST